MWLINRKYINCIFILLLYIFYIKNNIEEFSRIDNSAIFLSRYTYTKRIDIYHMYYTILYRYVLV